MIIDELNDLIDTNTCKNVNQQLSTENNEENILQSTQNASYAIINKLNNDEFDIEWKNKEYNQNIISYDCIAKFLCDYYKKDRVVFCTEYVRGNNRYRCHPNYCDNGPYYDWMLVLYDDNKNYPCKLIAVISGD